MDIDTKIGKKVAEIRHLRGLTQRELADMAECTYSQIANIELGKNSVTVKVLSRILNILNAKIDIKIL